MKRFFRLLKNLLYVVIAVSLATYGWLRMTAAEAVDLKNLKRGDIIFQTSSSSQSLAILLASKSVFSHVGIVDFDTAGQPVVLEAIATTRATPLQAWVDRGVGARVAIFRFNALTGDQVQQVTAEARKHFDKTYDLFFFNGDDQLYCSELVWLAFKAANIELGIFQSVGSLDLDNVAARKVIESRWQRYPLCAEGRVKNFEDCLSIIKTQTLITPEAIARDQKLSLIYSNYGALLNP